MDSAGVRRAGGRAQDGSRPSGASLKLLNAERARPASLYITRLLPIFDIHASERGGGRRARTTS